MSRKNIFQLVEENYNVTEELSKIKSQFNNVYYFQNRTDSYTFYDLIENYLFVVWKYRGTCVDVDEFINKAMFDCSSDVDYDTNYLEIIENFIKLYYDNAQELVNDYRIRRNRSFDSFFLSIFRIAEKHMGLSRREYKDKVILYPKNVALEKALETVSEEDVQWELIKYTREDLTLAQKKKSLSFLSTNLSIQKDKNEKNAYLNELLNKSCNILNNLHIRHDNMSGKSKNTVVVSLTEEEQSQLCDMLYDMMLNILIARDLKKYDAIYNKFNALQKN